MSSKLLLRHPVLLRKPRFAGVYGITYLSLLFSAV